jgi:hypothetical protein
MPILTTTIQHSTGRIGEVTEEKEIKVIQVRNKGKLSLFANVMVLYIGKPKSSIKKLL